MYKKVFSTKWGVGVYQKPQNQRKKTIQSRKRIRSKPSTACKTAKNDNFSYPNYQNPNRTYTVSDKWSMPRFRGFSRSVEVHHCRSDRGETGAQKEKSKTTSDTKSENSLVVFYENRKPNAKKRKSAYEHQNRKTGVFWHKKSKKSIWKRAKTAKPKSQYPPLNWLEQQ